MEEALLRMAIAMAMSKRESGLKLHPISNTHLGPPSDTIEAFASLNANFGKASQKSASHFPNAGFPGGFPGGWLFSVSAISQNCAKDELQDQRVCDDDA